MKRNFLILFTLIIPLAAFSQKIDSIYFHLYTDSLKKGQHNYINVDGKLTDGHWLPLTDKEILFSSSAGEFEHNDLILPIDLKDEVVKVKAILKSSPSIRKEISIWVKKKPDPDLLPPTGEILKKSKSKRKNLP
jgi:hypothetical protein